MMSRSNTGLSLYGKGRGVWLWGGEAKVTQDTDGLVNE